jgi:ribosomal subunit interface protein
MKIEIQSLGFDASKHLTTFVEENLTKLEKLFTPILEAQVSLKKGVDVEDRSCEIKLVIPGDDLFASKQGETFEIAVHDTIDALKHQIERLRTKWSDKGAGIEEGLSNK